MKHESVSHAPARPTIDQEVSHAQSVQLAHGETDASESQERNEDAPRCAFRYANRHLCRFSITPLSAPFCQNHSSFRPDDPDSINLAPALLGDLTELITAVDMQTTLSRLFILLAQNRVTTKKASVLTYIIQQLLHTLPAIEHETGEGAVTQVILDVPRPIRD
jgi:hypothetical protein